MDMDRDTPMMDAAATDHDVDNAPLERKDIFPFLQLPRELRDQVRWRLSIPNQLTL